MKKLIALLLAMVLVVGLCACGKKGEKKPATPEVNVDLNDAMANLDDALADLEDIDFGDDFDVDMDDLLVDEDITGRYVLTYIFDYEGTVVYDAVAEETELWIQLNADGTGSMINMDGDMIELGWSSGKLWYAEDPTMTSTFSVVDGTMSLDDGVYINSLEKQ